MFNLPIKVSKSFKQQTDPLMNVPLIGGELTVHLIGQIRFNTP